MASSTSQMLVQSISTADVKTGWGVYVTVVSDFPTLFPGVASWPAVRQYSWITQG